MPVPRVWGAGQPGARSVLGRVDAEGPLWACLPKWSGWIYEGECEFRVSPIARTGKQSLLLVGGGTPKIRAWPAALALSPGRYRVTAYLRGLDIGTGVVEPDD